MILSLAVGGTADAADASNRQTVSLNKPNPTSEEVDAALFPKQIVDLKAECASMEKAGLRCQSVIPKSSLDTIQITFARGSALLTDESKGFLRAVGASLKRNMGTWKSVAIEGHTDSTGSEEVNRRLSITRAESVKGFLVAEFGLSNIEAVGRSSEQPRDPDNPASGLNRRVEFVPEW